MKEELYNILKDTPEYKLFRKSMRVHSILALLVIAAFWAIGVPATDFNSIDDASMIYFGLLVLATIFLLRYAYSAFLKKPAIIAQGEIVDIRERERTRRDTMRGFLETVVSYQYLIHCENNDYWSESVQDYICRHEKHNIGEHVLFFSMAPGNNYIIKK